MRVVAELVSQSTGSYTTKRLVLGEVRMKLGNITEPMLKLLEDAEEAEVLLNKEPNRQFFRRAYIRSIFASIEGIIWVIKQTCLKARSPKGVLPMTIVEYAMLADESYGLKGNGETCIQTKFLRLPDNLRFTVKVVNRLFRMQLELGIGTTTWKNFQTALAIRHRITHPKNASDIDISDDEIEICKEVTGWFNDIVAKFIQNLVKTST